MRVLMLGWEFPPFISGGLGTACYGLTRALDARGHEILFVLPKAVDRSMASHVQLIAPDDEIARSVDRWLEIASGSMSEDTTELIQRYKMEPFEHVEFLGINSPVVNPYAGTQENARTEVELRSLRERSLAEVEALRRAGVWMPDELKMIMESGGAKAGSAGADYSGDVVAASHRYARLALHLCKDAHFDVIHAHDWMTYPAAMAIARITGRPLVAHIHSTEFDRSGEHVNQQIYDIERRGMHAAVKVIAVSMLTKGICTARYGVSKQKIEVIYNGMQQTAEDSRPDFFGGKRIEARDRIVLFLGRITMQKGPEYFVRAARRVLEKIPNVKFLVAGSGDMARRTIEHAAELGIGHKVLFTGFLRGEDVRRVFKMADLYVMPSVSEPFGIAPLEALANGTPALISKQSGVSEVLQNVLKVDFWDIDDMANKIVAVLNHPPLREALTEHGSMEVRHLTWAGAAERCEEVYRAVQGAVPPLPSS